MTEWGNAGMFEIYEEKSPKQGICPELVTSYFLKIKSKTAIPAAKEIEPEMLTKMSQLTDNSLSKTRNSANRTGSNFTVYLLSVGPKPLQEAWVSVYLNLRGRSSVPLRATTLISQGVSDKSSRSANFTPQAEFSGQEKSPKQNVYPRLQTYFLKRSKASSSTQSEVCDFTRNNPEGVGCGDRIFFRESVGLKDCAVFVCGNFQRRKAVRNPEGFPASDINAADCYESNLSATAEMINTSSARGTAALTLKVKPSRFTCVNISTETSEFFFDRIAFPPEIERGLTVCSSQAVAIFSSATPVTPAAAFHPGCPGIPARNLFKFRQRPNACYSRLGSSLRVRKNRRSRMLREPIVARDSFVLSGEAA